eukprot:Gb_19061 [translate_table: standard]
MQGRGLQECSTLEILDLSNCCLTDAVAPLLGSILKANVCRKAQAEWQGIIRSNKPTSILKPKIHGLVALDLSYNKLSDVSTQLLCSVLHVGAPLEALNLRGNQLSLISGKVLTELMVEIGVLRLVDLRHNVDKNLMCFLEEGEHRRKFSRPCSPFWCNSSTIKKVKKKRLKKKPSEKVELPSNFNSVEEKTKEAKIDACKVSTRSRSTTCSVVANSNIIPEKGRRNTPCMIRNTREALQRPSAPRKPLVVQVVDRNTLSSRGSSICRQPSLDVRKHCQSSTDVRPFIQNHQACTISLRSTPDIQGWDHGDEFDCGGLHLAMHMCNKNVALARQLGVDFGFGKGS